MCIGDERGAFVARYQLWVNLGDDGGMSWHIDFGNDVDPALRVSETTGGGLTSAAYLTMCWMSFCVYTSSGL